MLVSLVGLSAFAVNARSSQLASAQPDKKAPAKPEAGATERAIQKEIVVNATVDDVWKAWTTEAGVKTFFAPDARVELRLDGPYEIFFDPYAKPGLKGADDMRILAFQDKKMLSFTWNAPPHLPEARKQRTVVIVRLEPQNGGKTRVRLHHVGWGDGDQWDKAFQYFSGTWPRVLANLEQRFTKGPVDWTAWLEGLKKRDK
jgi:uncharacterized protein YndB with AHSA1/START domain